MGHTRYDDVSRERAAWNAGKIVGVDLSVVDPPLSDFDEFLPDRDISDVFNASVRAISLADVVTSVEKTLESTVLRDTRSAFATLVRAGVDLS